MTDKKNFVDAYPVHGSHAHKDETVTIDQDVYQSLKQDAELLSRLFAAGVREWSGYKVATHELSKDS